MVMEFGDRFAKTTGEVATKALVEGGGIAIGLIGSGAVGKYVEKTVKPGVVPTSSTTDKLIAWAANNVPKVALYAAVKQWGPQGNPRNLTDLMVIDAKKAAIASLVLDSAMRLSNSGAPGVGIKLFGIDVMGTPNTTSSDNIQKVLQENSTLRSQLNSALNRLASGTPPVNVNVTPLNQYGAPPQDHGTRFGMAGATAEAVDRRKRFGAMDGVDAMTPPLEDARNTRYSQMNKAKLNFAGESEAAAQSFGML